MHPQVESYRGNVDPTGPRSVYDEAKRFAESLTMAMHRTHGVDVAIVRIFNTYGPRLSPGDGRVVSNFVVQALRGEPLTVYGDGSQTRSLCYVDDEIGGLLALLDSSLTGPVNIGNPDERTVLELAHLVLELTGSSLGDRLRAAAHRRPDPALPRHHAGPHRAWAGSRAIELREGLARTIEYFARAGGTTHDATSRWTGDPQRRGPTGRCRVIMPVFNERTTVAEVIRRMRAVELPLLSPDHRGRRRIERRIGQGARRPRGLDGPRHPPHAEPGEGRGHPHRAGRGDGATWC